MLFSFALTMGLLAPSIAPQTTPAPVEAPRLVVVISIDQFIPNQMERLEGHFQGGLHRLRQEAAYFDQAALPYASTETGPGHATLSTGCLPMTHGIVGNVMRLREAGTGLYCVGDPEARDVTSAGVGTTGSVSAANLNVPTLGDHMKRANPKTKVYTVSGKDRSAVCMAGEGGDRALWWNRTAGGFQTSTAYGKALPGYVEAFNQSWIKRVAGFTWNPMFDVEHTPPLTAADDREGESKFPGGDRAFPHQVDGPFDEAPTEAQVQSLSSQVQMSGWGDRFTLEMAQTILLREGLGMDDVPDLLGIGLSGPDKIGHSFGPYSVEVTDCILQIDRDLAVLFALLDSQVGRGRWVLAMTADHGVLPLPESDPALHGVHGMSRVTQDQLKALNALISDTLKEEFGADEKDRGLRSTLSGGHLYFDRKDLAARKIDAAEARAVTARAIRALGWVHETYTLEQLAASDVPSDPFIAYFRNAYDERYCPDVTILQQEGAMLGWATGTTHGSPYDYDRWVPLYFLGAGIQAGPKPGPAGSHDIVPTLLGQLGIALPALDGRDLSAAMR